MEVTREELNPCTIKLTIVCDSEQVTDGFNKAFKQIAKSIKLPGFRPGHAPRAMLEGLVPRDELYEAAAEVIVQRSYKKAIESEGIESDASVRPTVELESLDRDKAEAKYAAKVPLPPKVTLGEYRGLPLERPPIQVTEEEIDGQIDEMRKRRQTRETVTDRGVETGDAIVLNVKIEGDAGDGRTFMLVAGQSFAQLDEALLGMKAEEMKNVELSFPEDFQESDWAGQTHHVQVTLNSLNAVKLPEVDDSFAQSLRSDNVEALRERIKKALEDAKRQMVRDLVNDRLLEKLHERSTVYVSDNMWEGLAAQRMRETQVEQNRAGKTLEQYAAENGMTIEQLNEAWHVKAKLHIERALLIKEVFLQEKMSLSNEELNVELYAMAEEYNVDVDKMVAMLNENRAGDELHFRAISRKVTNYLESRSVAPSETSQPAAAQPEESPSESETAVENPAEVEA